MELKKIDYKMYTGEQRIKNSQDNFEEEQGREICPLVQIAQIWNM